MMCSPRINKLKEIMYAYDENAIFYERMMLLEEAKRRFARYSPALRFAHTLAFHLDNMSIDIRPAETIVGFMAQVAPTPAQEQEFRRLAEDENFKMTPFVSFDPSGLIEITDMDERYCPQWFSSYGHNVPDYAWILKNGFSGIAEKARDRLQSTALAPEAQEFLNCCVLVCDAMCRFAKRYHDLALEKLQTTDDLEEIARYQHIAQICAVSPSMPCETLAQAFQTVWFVHLVASGVLGGRDFSFGRMDEYLLEYFDPSNVNSSQEAQELFEELYIHVMELSGFSVATYDSKRIVNTGSIQYIVLGGIDRSGKEVCNPLTFAALRANERLATKQPALILRWNPDINPELMQQAVKLCATGNGYPAFFDERKTINALVTNGGVSLEDARDFAYYGCNNVALPGLADELREVWYNVPKYLELALNCGIEPFSGIQIGANTCPVEALTDLDAVIEALAAQMRYFLLKARRSIINFDQMWSTIRPFSFESLLSSHAFDRASMLTDRGAKYLFYTNHFCGVATVANSLYTIKRLVYDEKRLSLIDLLGILKNDWREHEELRKEIIDDFEKFGNNQKEVDSIATTVASRFIHEIEKLPPLPNSRKPLPAFYSMSHHRNMGRVVGATPDGRMAHAPISESQSGTYGTEKRGPTASLSSAAKLPLYLTASGGNNLKLNPSMLKGKDGFLRLKALIETYFEQGGSQLQINIVDNNVLEDAILHPERHSTLLVRVIGYSAYFVMLSPEQQQEILLRNSF